MQRGLNHLRFSIVYGRGIWRWPSRALSFRTYPKGLLVFGAQVGGMGDVLTALARAVQEEGHEVQAILPKYDIINYAEVNAHLGDWGPACPLLSVLFRQQLDRSDRTRYCGSSAC